MTHHGPSKYTMRGCRHEWARIVGLDVVKHYCVIETHSDMVSVHVCACLTRDQLDDSEQNLSNTTTHG